MATDPVQQIQEMEHDTPLAMDLAATLTRLAALSPSSEAPYLTVRTGSQLGAKPLSNSKGGSVKFERAEAVGTRPLHSAHGRIHDYRAPSAPCAGCSTRPAYQSL